MATAIVHFMKMLKNNADYADNYAVTRFSSTSDGSKDEIVISPREYVGNGKIDGLKNQRSYTVNIFNTAKPEKVSIDGKALNAKSYSYDASKRTLTVKVPRRKCDTTTRINLN